MSPSKARITSLQVKCSVPTWDRDVWLPCAAELPFAIVQRAGEVPGCRYEGIAGTQNLLGHLIDAGMKESSALRK